ncbi:monooxygenase family protein [Labrys okinawensis]|uniref:monooxygenase family protein n=1 Tax=Labrys okinawensis TaxID=346911 RepID=UPI0039BC2759
MQADARRQTVDLSGYPDLVVVLLGFRVGSLRVLPALLGVGRGLARLSRERPEGLLGHQTFLFGWNHLGIRQYWRDQDSLTRFTREAPHAVWWRNFLRDTKGSGFWHEAYCARGGVEAVYVSMPELPGLGAFAPVREAKGLFMSSEGRLRADRQARAN